MAKRVTCRNVLSRSFVLRPHCRLTACSYDRYLLPGNCLLIAELTIVFAVTDFTFYTSR